MEKAHSFWRFGVTPTLSCGQERHLNAKLPTDATELESINRQCSSLCEYSEDEEEPGPHLRIMWKCGGIMLGRTEEPDIGMLCPKSKPQELPVIRKDDMWKYASLRSIVKNQSSDLICGTICLKVNILNLSCMTESFRTRKSKMGHNPPSFFGTMKYQDGCAQECKKRLSLFFRSNVLLLCWPIERSCYNLNKLLISTRLRWRILSISCIDKIH